MKLVLLITAQIEKGLEVAQAWRDAGAPGITIIRSYGIQTLLDEVEQGRVELPLMVSSMATAMAYVMDHVEQTTQIFLCVCDNPLVDPLIDAAQSVLGDLTAPYHGVLFVLDVERAIGVRNHNTG